MATATGERSGRHLGVRYPLRQHPHGFPQQARFTFYDTLA